MWRRPRHSALDDDEPERHLPSGFLQTFTPDARVEYFSATEIVLSPTGGGSGGVWVNGEIVPAQRSTTLFNTLSALVWDDIAQTLTAESIAADTEYWIYLANNQDATFNLGEWDFRGKLFLSRTDPYNNYLGRNGSGRNARLVGKIQTDSTAVNEGGPYFLRELDISIISRVVSLPETFREYSDFRVEYRDGDSVEMVRFDGAYGQIYVGGTLVYVGNGYVTNRTDPWIEWDAEAENPLIRHTDDLASSMDYYLYFSGPESLFNFNEINPATNAPWVSEDAGSEGYYDPALDMRGIMFVSPQPPDHGVLSETWPGYCARYVGRISTDSAGQFRPSRAVSAIRSFHYSSSLFEGMAEVSLTRTDASTLTLIPKRGSGGAILVAGDEFYAGQTAYQLGLNQPLLGISAGHIVTDGSPSASSLYYVYLSSRFSVWQNIDNVDYRGVLFLSETAPVNGYLSDVWPGNTARNVGIVYLDSGVEIPDSMAVCSAFDIVPRFWNLTDEDMHYLVVPDDSLVRVDLTLRGAVAETQNVSAQVNVDGEPLASTDLTQGKTAIPAHVHSMGHNHSIAWSGITGYETPTALAVQYDIFVSEHHYHAVEVSTTSGASSAANTGSAGAAAGSTSVLQGSDSGVALIGNAAALPVQLVIPAHTGTIQVCKAIIQRIQPEA